MPDTFESMKKENSKKKESPRKPDIGAMIARVYRLRILQGKYGEPATIYRYEQEEEEILSKLKKAGLGDDDIEKEIEKIVGG